MTVKELIEKLKEMPEDKEVYFYENDEWTLINNVYNDKDEDVVLSFL